MSRAALLTGLALVVAGLAGCTFGAGPATPWPTWPVSAEPLPAATTGSAVATVTCGGRTFPAAGLSASTGAEHGSGPAFDALRAALVTFGPEFKGSETWTWRLAGLDAAGAIFLAQTDALGPPGWVSIEVKAGTPAWTPDGMGQCDPHVVLSADYGPASWALDPAFGTPSAGATELHLLVWELACSNGLPATGRISAPVVLYGPATVTVTLGVRPIVPPDGTAVTCPGPPGTPATMPLAEPLGGRTLLDGGLVPPAPPSAAF